MNRIRSATLLEESSLYPKDFSIDAQIDAGVWGFEEQEKARIEMIFSKGFGDHLLESPLSKDQVTEELEGGVIKVSATVAVTSQLRWWLMGFGAGVEVLSPESLRQDLSAEYQAICEKYGNTGRG